MALSFTIVGIPFAILHVLIGSVFVKRGILNKVEKTIPLDKITDVGMVQEPIMRMFGIHGLSFETAGFASPRCPGGCVTFFVLTNNLQN